LNQDPNSVPLNQQPGSLRRSFSMAPGLTRVEESMVCVCVCLRACVSLCLARGDGALWREVAARPLDQTRDENILMRMLCIKKKGIVY